MGILKDTYGNVKSGDLITVENWNGLVAAIDTSLLALEKTLNEAITQQIQPLKTTVDTLDKDFKDFKNRVDPVFNQYYRLTLQTSKSKYLIGEWAEITVVVTSLTGGKVTSRPWIDFISTWGRLKPTAGFETELNPVSDRAVAVQVNTDGIAKVLVKNESIRGVPDDDEAHVRDFISTAFDDSKKSFQSVLMDSLTPDDSSAQKAFQAVSAKYITDTTGTFRNYFDSYYFRSTNEIAMNKSANYFNKWIHYPCTVVAFVKNDNTSSTPDGARGVASLQIPFRDWVGPWITNNFLAGTNNVQSIVDKLKGMYAKDYPTTAKKWKEYIADVMGDTGLLGKQRASIQFYRAIEEIRDGPRPPESEYKDSLDALATAVQSTIMLQQTLNISQYSTPYAQTQEAAMDNSGVAYQIASQTETANIYEMANNYAAEAEKARRDLDTAESQIIELQQKNEQLRQQNDNISQELNNLKDGANSLQNSTEDIGQKIERVSTQITEASKAISVINERVNNALTDTGMLGSLKTQVETMKSQVQLLSDLSPTLIKSKISEVEGLLNRVESLEKGQIKPEY